MERLLLHVCQITKKINGQWEDFYSCHCLGLNCFYVYFSKSQKKNSCYSRNMSHYSSSWNILPLCRCRFTKNTTWWVFTLYLFHFLSFRMETVQLRFDLCWLYIHFCTLNKTDKSWHMDKYTLQPKFNKQPIKKR